MSDAAEWGAALSPRPAAATVSLFQVVAYNLALGRRERGLTQDELGVRLEQITGRSWSRATISAAESAWFGRGGLKRERQFDAAEIVAFGLALQLPLAWFFLPPPERPGGDVPWITPDKGGRAQVPAMTPDFWVNMALRQFDPADPDQLMSRRLRKEGIALPTASEEIIAELSDLIDRMRALQQSSEDF